MASGRAGTHLVLLALPRFRPLRALREMVLTDVRAQLAALGALSQHESRVLRAFASVLPRRARLCRLHVLAPVAVVCWLRFLRAHVRRVTAHTARRGAIIQHVLGVGLARAGRRPRAAVRVEVLAFWLAHVACHGADLEREIGVALAGTVASPLVAHRLVGVGPADEAAVRVLARRRTEVAGDRAVPQHEPGVVLALALVLPLQVRGNRTRRKGQIYRGIGTTCLQREFKSHSLQAYVEAVRTGVTAIVLAHSAGEWAVDVH